jgi:hypothetical protein
MAAPLRIGAGHHRAVGLMPSSREFVGGILYYFCWSGFEKFFASRIFGLVVGERLKRWL